VKLDLIVNLMVFFVKNSLIFRRKISECLQVTRFSENRLLSDVVLLITLIKSLVLRLVKKG